MDHYQTRFPTNVVDVAAFLRRLTGSSIDTDIYFSDIDVGGMTELPAGTSIPPVLHYSSPEPFTKYEICLIFAKILGVPHAHIIADAEEPKAGTVRPKVSLYYSPCDG